MHLARRNRDLPTNDRKGERGCKTFRRDENCSHGPHLRDRRVLRGPRQSEATTGVRLTITLAGRARENHPYIQGAGQRRKLCDAHHSIDHSDSVINRSVPGVAVQLRLGLLSERRNWNYPFDRTDSRPNRTHLVRSRLRCSGPAKRVLSRLTFFVLPWLQHLRLVAAALRNDRSF
jgi:hypothetical protein